MFGNVEECPQTEQTPFRPRSPYAAAKVFAHWMTVQYRDAYGVFARNGIMFNHESPRRGATFLSRKVTRGVASIVAGQADRLYLGNLEAKRDWGYAPEYVEAMGRCSSSMNPTTLSSRPARRTASRTSSPRRSTSSTLIGSATSRSILAICARMRSTRCAGTPPRLGKSSAGSRGRHSTQLVRLMLAGDLLEAGLDPDRAMRPVVTPATNA